jgi:Domain of Unknown Function (DUF1259)
MMVRFTAGVVGLAFAAGLSAPALAAGGDWRAVAEVLGKAGIEAPNGVYRVGLPRTDLKVMLDGVELKPALAFGSWLAFRSQGDQTMVMGDLVLTADEVSPVMKKLAGEGIESPRCTTIFCARRPLPSICMCADMAIPSSSPPPCTTACS